jgi:hypothetical protein
MSGDARDFNIEEVAVFFLHGKALKKIHAILLDIREACTIECHRQKLDDPV